MFFNKYVKIERNKAEKIQKIINEYYDLKEKFNEILENEKKLIKQTYKKLNNELKKQLEVCEDALLEKDEELRRCYKKIEEQKLQIKALERENKSLKSLLKEFVKLEEFIPTFNIKV